VLWCSAPAFAMLPPPSQRLGTCTPEMARAEELFPQAGGLRVVVARFVGQDEASEKMGADLAYTLSQELPEYTRKSVKDDAQAAGLRGDEMQVQYVPCLMSSHSQARQVGQAWGADLLFWGQASCSSRDPLSCKLSPVVEKGAQVTVQVQGDVRAAKGNVRIGINDNRRVTVVAPPPSGLFKTSVTLVRWRGLQGRSDQSVRVDPAAATDLDFPRLASERPLALFRWAVGVYAFYSHRYALAVARFEEAEAELYAGAEDRSNLYRVMGTSYIYAGMPQRGLKALEQARASCVSSDVQCQGVTLINLGWAEARLGDKPKALSYYEQALPLQKQVGDRLGEAIALNNIGRVYDALGDKPKALSYYEQALSLQKQVGNRLGEAATLNNIGHVYSDLGDKLKALSYYEQALPLQRQVGDREGEGATLNNIGQVYSALGDKPKALSYFEQTLPLRKQVGDRSREATTLNNIGNVYDDLGDKSKALGYYEQALPLQKQVGDREGEATTLNNLGQVHSALGDKSKALSYYEQALPLQKQVGDRSGQAATLNNIGRVHSELGDKYKALSYYEQALPLQKQVGDREGQATTLNNIGLVYSGLGDKFKALGYYEQALPLRKQVGDRSGQAATLNNIGAEYDALGDKPKALSYYEQALPLQKQVGDRSGQATTLNNMGRVYDDLGDKPKALRYYEEALPLRKQVGNRSGEATTLNNIGSVYDDLGDKPKALSYFEQALQLRKQVGDRPGEAATLNNIGSVYDDLGDKPKALSYFEQALPLWRQVGDRSGEAITLDNVATVLAKLGQPLQSIARYQEASVCYLARRPPDTPKAVGSLRLAFGVALRSKLWPQAAKLLLEMGALKPPEVLHAQWRAQLAGYSGAADAAARYQELFRLAVALPEASQTRVRILAAAGELRAQQRSHFAECLGVVITKVLPDSQAARLGLQTGDIVVRYQEQCINEPATLVEAVQRTQPSQSVTLRYVRPGLDQTLSAKGGRLGISTEEF